MKKSDKIFIAGHNGLVGSAVFDLLKKKGFKNIVTIDRKKLDLRNFQKVKRRTSFSLSVLRTFQV